MKRPLAEETPKQQWLLPNWRHNTLPLGAHLLYPILCIHRPVSVSVDLSFIICESQVRQPQFPSTGVPLTLWLCLSISEPSILVSEPCAFTRTLPINQLHLIWRTLSRFSWFDWPICRPIFTAVRPAKASTVEIFVVDGLFVAFSFSTFCIPNRLGALSQMSNNSCQFQCCIA